MKRKGFEKKDKYLDLARELKKLWNTEVTIIPIVIGAFVTVTKGTTALRSWRMSGDHPNNSIIEKIQNTEKCSEDLKRLAVTKLQWKTVMSK